MPRNSGTMPWTVHLDVNLARTELTDVNLSGSVVRNANLSGVAIEGSKTEGMTIDGVLVGEMMAVYRAARGGGS